MRGVSWERKLRPQGAGAEPTGQKNAPAFSAFPPSMAVRCIYGRTELSVEFVSIAIEIVFTSNLLFLINRNPLISTKTSFPLNPGLDSESRGS